MTLSGDRESTSPEQTGEHLFTPVWLAPDVYVRRRTRALLTRTELPLQVLEGPMFALHLVPKAEIEIPLKRTSPMPLLFNGDSYETRIFHDGLLATRSEDGDGLRAYTHVRRDGVVEAVETRLLATRLGQDEQRLGMPAHGFDEALTEDLESLAGLVRAHEPDVEFLAYLSILDAGKCWFEVQSIYRHVTPLLSNEITLPSVQLGTDLGEAAERLSTYVWQAAGYESSPYKQQVSPS